MCEELARFHDDCSGGMGAGGVGPRRCCLVEGLPSPWYSLCEWVRGLVRSLWILDLVVGLFLYWRAVGVDGFADLVGGVEVRRGIQDIGSPPSCCVLESEGNSYYQVVEKVSTASDVQW